MIAFFYDVICILPIGLASMLLLRPHIGLPEEDLLFFAAAIILLLLVAGFFHVKYWGKGIIAGLLIFTALTAVWIQESGSRMVYVTEHLYFLWMFLTSIAAFLLVKLLELSKWFSRLFLVALMVGSVFLMYFNLPVTKLAAAMLFFLFLILIVQEVQRTWKKSGYTDEKRHLVFLTPFLLLCILAVFLIPAPNKAYGWDFARNLWEKTTKGIHITSDLFVDRSEDFRVMGFSDENQYAENLDKNNKEIMTLEASKDAGEVLYLPGRYFDTFDGRNWTVSGNTENPDQMMDTLETLCAVRSYDPYRFRDFLCRANVVIQYEKFYTAVVFLPQKAILERDTLGRLKYKEYSDGLQAKKKLGYGTEYNIFFYRINREAGEFQELIQADRSITKEDWDSCRKYYQKDLTSEHSYEDYLAYRDRIKETYTSDIALSPEVSALVEEICEGADSDLERLRRMESYLRGLRYELNPGPLPESVQTEADYLDYFLLEKKEGYCISYATAFALLARAEGYPVRYVQGYHVPVNGKEKVTVTSGMAHAWPEVYLDNFGWVGFEPTPGFYRYNGWATTAEEEALASAEAAATIEAGGEKPDNENANEDEFSDEEETEEGGFPYLLVLIPVLLTALLVGDFLIIEKHMMNKWYSRMDIKGKIRVISRRNMELLRFFKYGIKEGETLEEYQYRLKHSEEWKEADLEFLSCYEVISYSGVEASEELLHTTEESAEKLGEFLKAKTKWKHSILHWFVNRLWV